MEITIVRDNSLPIVEVQGWVRAGIALDNKRWLGELAPSMLKRGTQMHCREEFEDMLDEYALRYSAGSSSISPFFIEFSGKSLNAHLPRLLELIYESLQFSSFPESELLILKGQLEAELRNDASDPYYRAMSESMSMLYGPDHPYFLPPPDERIAQLKSVTRDELTSFFERHYAPNRSGIVIVGSVDADIARSYIEDALSKWNTRCLSKESAKDSGYSLEDYKTDEYEERTVFIPQKTSAILQLTQRVDITSLHSDYPALRIAVGILGGGAHARLFQHVRERQGLSYNVGAQLARMHTISGYLDIFAYTNPDNIKKTQEETWRVLIDFCEHGITQEELTDEKSIRRGNRSFSRSSFSGIAQETVEDKIIGRTANELEQHIYKLELDEVNRAISKYIKPASMKVVRAGTVN